MTLSRRHFCWHALAITAGFRAARASSVPVLAIDQIHDSSSVWNRSQSRAYRADVVVTFLGVPIFSRQAVGSAFASVREHVDENRRTVSLTFSGGSHPARTHGVNYCGSTEEVAVECGDSILESAASFGFVTASQADESFEQARHRLETGTTGAAYVAVDELHRSARVHLRRAVLPAPESWTKDRMGLVGALRSRFSQATPTEREVGYPAPEVPRTFLYAVLATVRSPEKTTGSNYVHDGKRYRLQCEKAPDPHAAGVTRVTGHIRDLEAGKNSTFRVWLDGASELPHRIEFSPRSYLRINLEVDSKEEM
jgi:hypothetical protein